MNIAVVASIAMILATIAIHFGVLWSMSATLLVGRKRNPGLVLLAIIGVFGAHLIEIALYAATYAWLINSANVGNLQGLASTTFMDYF